MTALAVCSSALCVERMVPDMSYYSLDRFTDVPVLIANMREARGMSYREFGRATGVSYVAVYNIERRKTSPTWDTLVKILNWAATEDGT
jgi:DNA-binding XRE family transcriptional regulator